MKNKPRILFTTPVLQYPAVGGPYLRIENSIKALDKISELYIYSRVSLDAIGGATALSFYQHYCKNFYFSPCTVPDKKYCRFGKRAINFMAREITKNNIFTWGKESSKDFQELLEIADTIQADVIWLGFGNISYPLLKYIHSHSNYQVVLDTDSVWSRFILRGLPFATNKSEYQKIKKAGQEKEEEERWGTQLADVTTAVSEVDANYYSSLAKHPQQIHLFSNVVDTQTYQQVPPPADNFKNPCIYLAGTFYPRSPMDDAARWVIREVLPLVRQQIPNIHFYILGTGSKQTLSDINDPGITVVGKLPSVLPYLYYVDVALVPLRFESGTRFKILEAGACGIPVVSTTLGAEGIPVTHGDDILIADEPNTFADSIIHLIKQHDFAIRMANILKILVDEKYSVASLAKEGQQILDYLTQGISLLDPEGVVKAKVVQERVTEESYSSLS